MNKIARRSRKDRLPTQPLLIGIPCHIASRWSVLVHRRVRNYSVCDGQEVENSTVLCRFMGFVGRNPGGYG